MINCQVIQPETPTHPRRDGFDILAIVPRVGDYMLVSAWEVDRRWPHRKVLRVAHEYGQIVVYVGLPEPLPEVNEIGP